VLDLPHHNAPHILDKAKEYRQNAELCRRLAAGDGRYEQALLHMAETWERLASERDRKLKEAGSGS
jgi:hypothetical protein